MYLKSLDTRGFKSFADRTTLDFEPGISVIVGPNGSGKSNLADAVLWVLGEQSPRSLRGSKMEDVIFEGSATRRPLGMAEVSLSFDNRDGGIPVDFPEVVVTRRICRNGESEYLLNRTPCRLVDIQELLSDLGIGRELTAVIGQNKLEAILRSQPEDRRAFLEEAAGLRKHRRRKEKALRKMEGTERNLLRVKDIISEVNKQLRPLERQARQAREYGELAAEIRELSIRITVAELQELKAQWENRREEEEKLSRELEDTSARLLESKGGLAVLEGRLRELREDLEGCRAREMRLLSLGERLRSCQSLGEERLKLYAALGGDTAYRDGWRSRREEMARRRADLEEERAAAAAELPAMEAETARLRGARKDLAGRLNQARRERDALRKSLAELRESERGLGEESGRAAAAADSCREEAAETESRREELAQQLGSLRRGMEEGKRETASLGEERERARGRMASAREGLARARKGLEEIESKRRSSFEEGTLAVARLRALKEVFASRLDYAAAAQRLLDAGEAVPGVLGTLLHRMSIGAEWEKALEAFLGPWLFCVVTRDVGGALEAVRALKRGGEGYGIFLPLREAARDLPEGRRDLARVAGGTPALDVVDCDAEVRPALEYLLGEVVLCSSLEEAEGKAARYPDLTFVTAEGDVIAPRSAVKGGAGPRSPFHVIAKRREMERLQEMLDLCEREGAALEAQRVSTRSAVAELEKDLEALGGLERELESQFNRATMSLREHALRVQGVEAELAAAGERMSSLQEEEAARRAEALSLQEAAGEAAAERRRREPGLADLEARLEGMRRGDREAEESLQAALARSASLAERLHHLEQRMGEIDAEAEGTPYAGRAELVAMVGAQEEVLSLVAAMAEAHARLAERAGRDENQMRVQLQSGELEQEEARRGIEELTAREGELRELVHNRDLAVAELRMRVDMLVQRLLDEHRLAVETALADYLPTAPVAEMRERLERQERRRDMLGQVNLRAVEEHRALQERYDFLVEQVEDLRESKASLLKVVRAIDREIVRIFKQTFDEVNRHFQELFAMLFPQGRAELALSDPTDLLNTGVEIEAQPRGKRLRKLSLLSGGETSLTALAFLFALFRARPSPFYFLDEVEAALDDVNLHRFLSMLKEFKRDSQLVVITHQKRTMEIADILYGVSMQASGVSRVVSQRMDEAQRLAPTGS